MSNQILSKVLGRNNSSALFNFSKSIKENINYSHQNTLPIEAKTSSWDEFDNLMVKDFLFDSNDHMIYFIKELIVYKFKEYLVMTIENNSINVKVTNIEGNSVGKKEIMICKYIDEIYDDITFIQF